MKKIIVLIAALVAVLVIVNAVAFAGEENNDAVNAEYLRIHIRANSNSEIDQNVKYKVKAAVVDALTPELDGVKNKEEAMEVIY